MQFSWLVASLCAGVAFAAARTPDLVRVYPLSGQAGSTISLEILGTNFSNVTSVEFDSRDLIWVKTLQSTPGKIVGEVRIAPIAALGAHRVRVSTLDGPSSSSLFNVEQFPSVIEVEPNDQLEKAQRIESFPVNVQGRLDGAADIDIFSFRVNAGERRVFDLRSIENGSAVETRMILMDAEGNRIGFNDDRDDYNENPLIEYTFQTGGTYYLKLDQYRGPRGFNFGKKCAYTLRISALPLIANLYPLAARSGSPVVIRLGGSHLSSVSKVFLTEIRQAEYSRMTYPFTMPIHFRADAPTASEQARVEGRVQSGGTSQSIHALFQIPATARPGLWRLWAVSPNGTAEGLSIDIVDWPVVEQSVAAESGLHSAPLTVNGALNKQGEKHVYRVEGRKGQPLHFWTLAAQLGVPFLDSVLLLRDASGKKIAENDDVVAGQGTLLGNPDSSLFYIPQQDGPLFLEIFDRTRRGGPGFEYCLHFARQRPGFQLFTTPENFTVASGRTGELKVHLIREAGFEGAVDVWFEGLNSGVESQHEQFRADQLFEPNADGADMIIPEITFRIQAPNSIPIGSYPVRVFGAPVTESGGGPPLAVEAHATMMMGPLLDAWNFVRRPLPAITMTVIPPFDAELLTEVRTLRLGRGKSATLQLKAEKIPEQAQFRLINLPDGVLYRVLGRQGSQVTITLEASPQASIGTFDIAAETEVGNRKTPSASIALSVHASDGP